MFSILQKIRKISQQLYPTGKAFRFNYRDAQLGSFDDSFDQSFDVTENVENPIRRGQFHAALAVSEEKAFKDAINILDASLPDNANFTVDDAKEWERRLGMITNISVPLQDRMDAIIRKMNHPGNIRARQGIGYLQDQLRLAGFDVYVHENLNNDNIVDYIGEPLNFISMGDDTAEMGEAEMGSYIEYNALVFTFPQMGVLEMGESEMDDILYSNIVENYIEEDFENAVSSSTANPCFFFIGGQEIGSFASIDINRKLEFRQLVLTLKPVQTIAVLLIKFE